MTNKEHQEWVIQKLNEDYVKRLEDYKEIIEQQKEIIRQQKELIDKLLIKVNDDNRIVIPVEKDKQVPNYPYPYYITPPIITCSTTTSTDTEYKCTAPKGTQCDGKCKDCCYHTLG